MVQLNEPFRDILNQTTVFQWNANGLRSKISGFKQLVRTHSFPLLAISEAGIEDVTKLRLSGYSYSTSARTNGVSRALVAVRNDLVSNEHQVPPHETNEYACVTVRNKSKTFTLISAYIQPQVKFDIGRLETLLETTPSPHVLCGDFNAHHELWGGRYTDTRGSALLSIIEKFNLCLLNDGSATFHRGNSSSALDLTFVSADQYHNFRWTTDLESRGSDHMPLLIFCKDFTECKKTHTLIATNWEKFLYL